MKSDRSAALLLMGAAIFGLILANSPFGPAFLDFKGTYVGIEFLGLELTVGKWVSDLILATFFLVAGLELKYEIVSGVLSKTSTAIMPVVAGVGGVVMPALIYYAINAESGNMDGWPIPTATDIAFALGILAIFGRGLPKSARVFLLALAIFDDMVAITIIALFFTDDVSVAWLVVAAGLAAAHLLAERFLKIPMNPVRVLTFVLLWYAVYQSGVHATVAGVILGLIIPAKRSHSLVARIQPWTNTISLPLFALFAVGIALPAFDGSFSNVFIGILVALPVGKIVGITLFAVIANALIPKEARLDLKFLDFVAIAGLAGVGFTVSLLMTKLAFAGQEQLLAEATLAVIMGSLISMAVGASLASYRGRQYMKQHRAQNLAKKNQ